MNRLEAPVDKIATNQLYVALIAAGLAAVTALAFFILESKRARRDRREEYFLDSAGDLADRIWDTLIALRAHSERPTPWPEVRRTALVLRAGLLGQAPRYRLAGVDAASGAVTEWLGSFVGYWASTLGRAKADREFLAARGNHSSEPADQASTHPAAVGSAAPDVEFTENDLDAAMLTIYRDSLDKLEDLVVGVLEALSVYIPGKQTLQVQPPLGTWPDYEAARATATTERRNSDRRN
jgi:hypothetical protein